MLEALKKMSFIVLILMVIQSGKQYSLLLNTVNYMLYCSLPNATHVVMAEHNWVSLEAAD